MIGIHNHSSKLRWKGNQRRIGITGGIATGKSAIGDFLKSKKDIPILDADEYSKEVLTPGKITTRIVIDKYGEKILLKETNAEAIDRRKLAKIIFSNKKERKWLEELILPKVKEKIILEIDKYHKSKLIGMVIPLLFERKYEFLCSEVWVVTCKIEQQYKRLIERDSITEAEARLRINSQLDLETKQILADFVIDNSGKVNSWISQVESLI